MLSRQLGKFGLEALAMTALSPMDPGPQIHWLFPPHPLSSEWTAPVQVDCSCNVISSMPD